MLIGPLDHNIITLTLIKEQCKKQDTYSSAEKWCNKMQNEKKKAQWIFFLSIGGKIKPMNHSWDLINRSRILPWMAESKRSNTNRTRETDEANSNQSWWYQNVAVPANKNVKGRNRHWPEMHISAMMTDKIVLYPWDIEHWLSIFFMLSNIL